MKLLINPDFKIPTKGPFGKFVKWAKDKVSRVIVIEELKYVREKDSSPSPSSSPNCKCQCLPNPSSSKRDLIEATGPLEVEKGYYYQLGAYRSPKLIESEFAIQTFLFSPLSIKEDPQYLTKSISFLESFVLVMNKIETVSKIDCETPRYLLPENLGKRFFKTDNFLAFVFSSDFPLNMQINVYHPDFHSRSASVVHIAALRPGQIKDYPFRLAVLIEEESLLAFKDFEFRELIKAFFEEFDNPDVEVASLKHSAERIYKLEFASKVEFSKKVTAVFKSRPDCSSFYFTQPPLSNLKYKVIPCSAIFYNIRASNWIDEEQTNVICNLVLKD